jgi:hypothetical protein
MSAMQCHNTETFRRSGVDHEIFLSVVLPREPSQLQWDPHEVCPGYVANAQAPYGQLGPVSKACDPKNVREPTPLIAISQAKTSRIALRCKWPQPNARNNNLPHRIFARNSRIGACGPHFTYTLTKLTLTMQSRPLFQCEPLFDAVPFGHTRLHSPSNKNLHCSIGSADVAYPLFGLLVVFSGFCWSQPRWVQARGVCSGTAKHQIKHASRRVCKGPAVDEL